MNWVETTADFYSSYNRLATYFHQKVSQEKLRAEKIAYISQFPMEPVISLLRTMQGELELLLQDAGRSDTLQQLSVAENYKKLASHTRTMKRLSQQAQTKLFLITSTTQ